jgi:drug/metabolite transporter (DMT)-like permease
VLIAAAPLFTALLSWFVLRERTSRRVWIAIGVTVAAIGLVISGSLGGGHLDGDLAALGATVAYCCLTVALRRHPGVDRSVVVGIGGLVMAAAAVLPATLLGHSVETWLALLTMGVIVGPIARALIATAPRHLPATEVALFAPIETVLATLWAYFAFDEAPSTRTWVGGVVIVAAVVWATWPRRPARPADGRRPSSGVTARRSAAHQRFR